MRHHAWSFFGYPAGLKGPEIPLGARILAIAEVFDALVTPRSYRAAFAFADAVTRLRGMAGSQLDPSIVDAFERTITAERWQLISDADVC